VGELREGCWFRVGSSTIGFVFGREWEGWRVASAVRGERAEERDGLEEEGGDHGDGAGVGLRERRQHVPVVNHPVC
jgi:hypothetical protein